MNAILLEFPKEGEELTFGHTAVGIKFNPSGSTEVDKAKLLQAAAIDQLHNLRTRSESSEQKRLASVAITETQGSQMWGVKAITWQD